MATIRKIQTTNQVLFDTIRDLKKLSNSTGAGVYRAVAAKLAAPASQRPQVNLDKISKYAAEGETVIVPGKVLGNGMFTKKKVTVVGFRASETAIEKLEKAGSKFVEIREYIKAKPDSKMRILG